MELIQPKYKKGDIIIKNKYTDIYGNSYISPHDIINKTTYTIRKIKKRMSDHYVYGFISEHWFVYDTKIIDKQFDLYDNNYIRKEKLKRINEKIKINKD